MAKKEFYFFGDKCGWKIFESYCVHLISETLNDCRSRKEGNDGDDPTGVPCLVTRAN